MRGAVKLAGGLLEELACWLVCTLAWAFAGACSLLAAAGLLGTLRRWVEWAWGM